MLSLTGQLVNVAHMPEGKREDGTKYGGDYQIQLMCNTALKNGENRVELVNLRVPDDKPFQRFAGKTITLPVSCFAKQSVIVYFIPKELKSEDISEAKKAA